MANFIKTYKFSIIKSAILFINLALSRGSRVDHASNAAAAASTASFTSCDFDAKYMHHVTCYAMMSTV